MVSKINSWNQSYNLLVNIYLSLTPKVLHPQKIAPGRQLRIKISGDGATFSRTSSFISFSILNCSDIFSGSSNTYMYTGNDNTLSQVIYQAINIVLLYKKPHNCSSEGKRILPCLVTRLCRGNCWDQLSSGGRGHWCRWVSASSGIFLWRGLQDKSVALY